MEQVFAFLKRIGIDENIKIEPTLALEESLTDQSLKKRLKEDFFIEDY